MNSDNNFLPLLFQDKPLFGMDIGNGSLKLAQTKALINSSAKKPHSQQFELLGYGASLFDKAAINNGVIVQPEIIAESCYNLFKDNLIGIINSHRVAMTIPTYRTFTRAITLPKLSHKEMENAVRMEAEQYITISIDELYLDYSLIKTNSDNTVDVLLIAVSKDIVDSYMDLAHILGLEVVLIETTMSSAVRLFKSDYANSYPTIIIDFGSLSSDISISLNGKMLTSSTVEGGGEIFTQDIMKGLKVNHDEAHLIKTKYGLGLSKRQKEVIASLSKTLNQIIKEIQRLLRFYEENYGTNNPIKQLVTLGGGSNMPGLNEFLTDNLRLAVRPCDPWEYLKINQLKIPLKADKLMYATVMGLAMAQSQEIFK